MSARTKRSLAGPMQMFQPEKVRMNTRKCSRSKHTAWCLTAQATPGCGSFVTSNTARLPPARLSPPSHPPRRPPSSSIVCFQSTYYLRRISIFTSVVHTPPALSRCRALTSPTTTATRLSMRRGFPFLKPLAPVQQLSDVFTITELWYVAIDSESPKPLRPEKLT